MIASIESFGPRGGGLSHWVACSLVAVALAFPFVFGALDHHAAERIPTHGHLGALGEIGQVHLHEFEAPHAHGPTAGILINRQDLGVYSAAGASSFVLSLLLALALPVLAAGFGLGPAAPWPRFRRRAASGQISSRPPTPPPTSRLASA